jgi:Sulfotransferase family
MIGQHPQLYGLPEILIFAAATVSKWLEYCSRASYRDHGLLRTIAELYFGAQTAEAVELARGWLARRSHLTTGMLFEALAQRAYPRILVDKSPATIYESECMQRAFRWFPAAKFVHLVRHPRGYGESLMRYRGELEQRGPLPKNDWVRFTIAYARERPGLPKLTGHTPEMDPQRSWFYLNMTILEFLKSVPEQQKICIRGEDVVGDPDRMLPEIARWIGVRSDPEAVESMKRPERSPYACWGPSRAPFGNDHHFLADPVLRTGRASQETLAGPLSWREDGGGFLPRVKSLAEKFGYQ